MRVARQRFSPSPSKPACSCRLGGSSILLPLQKPVHGALYPGAPGKSFGCSFRWHLNINFPFFLVYRNPINICIFTFYPPILLNFISSSKRRFPLVCAHPGLSLCHTSVQVRGSAIGLSGKILVLSIWATLQNTIDWIAYKQQKIISHSSGG